MFEYRRIVTSAVATSALAVSSAYAVPYNSMDPRTLAMGGAGVASGSSANAAFMNPALLAAAHEDDSFSVELPIVGVRFNDPEDVMDELDNYQDDDLEANLSTRVDLFLVNPSAENARQVGRAADAIATQLNEFADSPVQGEVFTGLVVGIPSKKIGASLAISGWAVGGGQVNVAQADLDLIADIVADSNTGDPNDLAINTVITDHLAGDLITDKLASNLEVRGAAIQEVALALSHEVWLSDFSFAVGITPKLVKVRTFDYQLTLDDADIDTSEGTKDSSNVNLDIGVAKNYANGWRTGLVIKNLIGQEYKTVNGNKMTIDPQVRLGIAHTTDWASVALDVDLTENEPAGFESKSQYISLGAELDAFDTVQLRAGYRHNLSDTETNIPTIGLGFSPFGAHVDIALAATGNELAGSMQLGFRF